MVAAENSKRARGGTSEEKPEANNAPPYPCSMKEVLIILNKWVQDGAINLPEVEREPSSSDKKHERYCAYHRRVKHPTSDCWSLKRIFSRKVKANELEFTTSPDDVSAMPYLEHGKRKEHVYTAANRGDIELNTKEETREDTSGYETMATKLQDLQKFRHFYDQMGFNEKTRFEATKAMIRIAHEQNEESFAVGGSGHRAAKVQESRIIFSDADLDPQCAMHNRPLYLTALINGNEVRRVLIDGGSSINVMPLATIEAAGISKDRIVEQIIEIAGFAAEGQATLGHITVDLEVGQIKKPTRFHVINTRPSYHILLGRPWIHKARAVPSSLHQCLKAVVNGKCVTIPTSIMPFKRREAHIVEVAFFEEAAPDGEATLTIPRSVHLPKWEEA